MALAAVIVTRNNPNVLVGPLPVGIIGSLGFALLAVVLFVRKVEIPVEEPRNKPKKPIVKRRK